MMYKIKKGGPEGEGSKISFLGKYPDPKSFSGNMIND